MRDFVSAHNADQKREPQQDSTCVATDAIERNDELLHVPVDGLGA